ncbi:MAG TPA: hypothetical protein VJ044_17260, partial [Candidatus Hodarchaeales archaeon]|nr:hypothetical protein [Candidatus Hodarchaeales archaeon]
INFTRYVQLVEQSKGLTFNAFSVQTAYPNLTASVASDMNATVFNLLGEQILFLNLTNADQSGSQSFTTTNVPDNTTVSSPFTINIGSDTNFTFYVFWNTSTRNSTDSFLIPAQISGSKYVGYFDITLIGKRSTHRDKFVETDTITKP